MLTGPLFAWMSPEVMAPDIEIRDNNGDCGGCLAETNGLSWLWGHGGLWTLKRIVPRPSLIFGPTFAFCAEHNRGALRDESSLLAKLAQLDRAERSVRHRRQDAPSTAVAGECPPAKCPRGCRSGRARRVAAMDAARPPGILKSRSRNTRAPCFPCTATQPRQTGPSRATSCGRAVWPDQIRRSGKYSLSGRSLRPSTRLRREPEPRTRRGGMVTVAAALALAVMGTVAYRTYVGSPRSGEPPIITADDTRPRWSDPV